MGGISEKEMLALTSYYVKLVECEDSFRLRTGQLDTSVPSSSRIALGVWSSQ